MQITNLYKKYKIIKEKQKHILAFRKGQKAKVRENTILFESLHGKSVDGHIFHMIKYIYESDRKVKIYVAVRDIDSSKKKFEKYGITNINYVKHMSREYGYLLAVCKYLINDNTFYPFFSKRKEQKYYNIWHGTPLKTLGKDMENIVGFSNVQRNFLISDGLIVGNDYTKDILVRSHNIDKIYNGKVIIGPSPRNSALFDKNRAAKLRNSFGWEKKKIVMYMPTWRGIDGNVRSDDTKIVSDLSYLSNNVDNDTVIIFKGHTMQSQIKIDNFKNVYSFPVDIELYDFLSCVDILITDYSSIMYDFLNKKRKIILYTYDKQEYFSSRGVYEDIDNYPFVQVETIEELAAEINAVDCFRDYTDFEERFCKYDCENGADIIVDYIFANKMNEKILESSVRNEKENVFIFCGGLWDNGITTALLNTLSSIDTSKRNYVLFFGKSKLSQKHQFRLQSLPPDVQYYPISGISISNLFERIIHKRFLNSKKTNSKFINNVVKNIYNLEIRRMFGDTDVDWFIHYTGFDRKYAEIVSHINTKTMMFVHTDMFEDYKNKKNYNQKVIYNAYKSTSKIVLVNDGLVDGFKQNLPTVIKKLEVANNFLGEQRIRDLSKENIFITLKNVFFDSVDSSHIVIDPLKRYEKLGDYEIDLSRKDSLKRLTEKGYPLAIIEHNHQSRLKSILNEYVKDNYVENKILKTKQIKEYIAELVKVEYLEYEFPYRTHLINYLKDETHLEAQQLASIIDNILINKAKIREVKKLFPYTLNLIKEYEDVIAEEFVNESTK
ncbi:CDP-glycerol glycerophosphotransferase family protein [Terrilactibacillus laevilacticus]|uniref:CDP-glycerol glycerophosphotransferase family protein n=1 Tax=Terrilactibacillus laevilacticus TaxID=1380157 RepID=A0ABW5PQB0_9BACI|nr:CDP-glycerol glycerophosphotransferase family protein [Terrilactibacillus laevilacticus]